MQAIKSRHGADACGLVSHGAPYFTDLAPFLTGQGGLNIGRTYGQDTDGIGRSIGGLSRIFDGTAGTMANHLLAFFG